ncbi:preprotein translocase subunit YajC [Canibacter zhoujuaniae]|uniref:preprotein translocase subunit YajC n=1 Tax=Canibacter zhoujuaniae TaxID=2708343 RepID=UPI00141E30C5|nr:preprotein translocase subunit YajC [Canibacter zhoujuaniae]
MPFDPVMIIMLGLLALMVFMMFRNSRRVKAQREQMNSGLQPGVEIMTTSGIYGRIITVDRDSNRATIASGDAAIEIHIQAIREIVPEAAPADIPAAERLTETEASDPAVTDDINPSDENGNRQI